VCAGTPVHYEQTVREEDAASVRVRRCTMSIKCQGPTVAFFCTATMCSPGSNAPLPATMKPVSSLPFKSSLRSTRPDSLVKKVEQLNSEKTAVSGMLASSQGLTLVHFSAQLEPCLTNKDTLHTP